MSRRYHFNRMGAEQFRAALVEINLTPGDFAFLSGANSHKVADWLKGEEDIPPFVPVLLTLLMMPGAVERARAVAFHFLKKEDTVV